MLSNSELNIFSSKCIHFFEDKEEKKTKNQKFLVKN